MTQDEILLSTLQSRFGTQDLTRFNIRRQPYYDFVRYPVAGTTQLRFFTNPLGATDPVSSLSKTEEQTNLNMASRLPQNFLLTQIKTYLHPLPKRRQDAAILALPRLYHSDFAPFMRTLHDLSGQGVLYVTFGNKQSFDIEQPFRKCPPGFGEDIYQIPAAQGTTVIPQNVYYLQSNLPSDVYNLTPPVFIEKNQTLDVYIDFPNATSPTIAQLASANIALNVGIIFDGLVIEPIQ